MIKNVAGFNSIKNTIPAPPIVNDVRSTTDQKIRHTVFTQQKKDHQEVWRTRSCPEECFSDQDWNKTMTTAKHSPSEKVTLFKYYGLYSFSLALTQILSILLPRNWCDKITTTGPHKMPIYLGALPVSTLYKNDLELLKKEKIGAILSLVEPFENHSIGWVTSPITPTEWENASIKQLQIPIEDFKTGTIEQVEKGVEFIRWNVLNRRSVYVHCKAGRGRSALVLLAYLIKYENLSAKEAFTLMRSKRPHAGFGESSSKMKTLLEYEKLVNFKKT